MGTMRTMLLKVAGELEAEAEICARPGQMERLIALAEVLRDWAPNAESMKGEGNADQQR